MPELREVFEMTVKQMGEPDLDSWQQQEKRQRRAGRNKKLGAIIVVALLLIGVIVAVGMLGSRTGAQVVPGSPSASAHVPGQALSVVDVGSGESIPFAAPVAAWGFDVSADGSMVAYAELDPEGNEQVFVMDVDGSDARQLTHGKGDLQNHELPGGPLSGLDWSPDDSTIAYQRETADGPQVFTVRLSDGVSHRVTNDPQGAVSPGGWTSDGGSIVFMTPNYSIDHYSAVAIDLKTGRTEQIVPDASSPEVSPDGTMIAFNSWLKTHIRLFVASSDGSGRHLIARFDGGDALQEWSPDGTRLAFAANLGANGFGTYIYDLAAGTTQFVNDGTIESWIDNDHVLVS